jgi:hypothetical protein
MQNTMPATRFDKHFIPAVDDRRRGKSFMAISEE